MAADFEKAKRLYPSTTKLSEKDWVEFFDRRPDVMHAILGDIYVHTKAHMDSVKKTGRRPRHVNGNMDELWDMITPQYAMEPFGTAVVELMNGQSLRQFSAKIPMHHESLSRLINGERNIINVHRPFESMQILERIAIAGKVHPAYFVEWRTLYVLSVMSDMMASRPNVSIGLVRQIGRSYQGPPR
jgi:hypothetical protein